MVDAAVGRVHHAPGSQQDMFDCFIYNVGVHRVLEHVSSSNRLIALLFLFHLQAMHVSIVTSSHQICAITRQASRLVKPQPFIQTYGKHKGLTATSR